MSGDSGHWGFILASYTVTALVLAGLIASIVLDLRRQRKLLADLEAGGSPRRRSASANTPASEAAS